MLDSFLSSQTLAYIGPGTATIIIQVIATLMVGGATIIKINWRRIKEFFNKNKSK